MADAHTCPSGHRWDGDQSAGCPACAAESRSPSESDTAESDDFDEFPPPPSPGSLGRAPFPHPDAPTATAGSPTIPGYELLGELGRGGMGVVYKARQVKLDRLVALKVVLAGEHADPRELARFRAEAEAIARLQHPNVVQIFEVGEHDGRPFLALELLEGGTLAAHLAGTPLPSRAAAELAETLAQAVHSAHQRGVVHRDLKPSNILLPGARGMGPGAREDPAGPSSLAPGPMPLAPKVTDFGLAKRLDDDSGRTRSGQVVGTPSYMAPEQAAGQGNLAGPAADVYALGAILYECLTGRPPFRAATSIDTLLLVLEQDPVPPARLQPKLPCDLETVCLKCLAKEPRKRYATAEALADDLRRFLDGRPVLARRTPGWERAWKWARRKPAWAALIVLAVGAAGVIGGLGYGHLHALEDHNRELGSLNRELERKNEEVRRERDETRAQRDRAETNLGNAVEAVDGMLVRVGLARVADLPHIDRTRASLLADALTMYDQLLATQRDDPRLRIMIAYTLERSGSILLHLGRTGEARERFDRSLALLREVERGAPAGALPETALRFKARTHSSLGAMLARTGAAVEAWAEQEAALAVREELFAAHPTDPEYRYDLASSYHDLALLARAERASDQVSLYLGRARPHVEELTRSDPKNEAYAYLAGLVLNDSGVYCLENDDTPRAVSFLERGLETWRKLVAIAPGDRGYRRELARSLSNLGTAWRLQGHLKRAAGLYAEALAIRERLAGDHPEARDLQIDLAWSYVRTGDLHAARGESEPAAGWYTKAFDRLGTGPGEPRRDGRVREVLREAYHGRAAAFERMNRAKDAADDRRRAAELGDAQQTR